MKVLFRPLTLAALLVASACTSDIKDDIENIDPNSKTSISFSVEENHTPMTRAGFTASTKIAMRIKSENGTAAKYTRTVATASAAASGKEYSDISTDGAYIRYWDDAFGRAAKLSVFALAVPNKTDVVNNGKNVEQKLTAGGDGWFTEATENEKINWTVSTEQTAETLANEDLTYSNNIKEGGLNGVYKYDFATEKYPVYSADLEDGQMQFRLRVALAGCSSDELVNSPKTRTDGEAPIAFSVEKKNITRATNLEDLGHYNFGVWAYKTGTSGSKNVMNNYLVGYSDGTAKGYEKSGASTWKNNAGSETDHTSPWFYENLGTSEYSYNGTAGFYKDSQTDYMSANQNQYLRYWDLAYT